MPLQAELVEQRTLVDPPITHHGQLSFNRRESAQDLCFNRLFQQNRPVADLSSQASNWRPDARPVDRFSTIQVAILWLHDWLPLPPFIDVKGVQAADSRARLIRVTIVQSFPYTVGLLASIAVLVGHPQGWLRACLWVSYGLLFAGELRAWWVPYLLRPEPERAARYQTMFGATHAFLPVRNGIVPNTLHCVLHAATAGTLLVLILTSLHVGS